jgi:hypothetical protein
MMYSGLMNSEPMDMYNIKIFNTQEKIISKLQEQIQEQLQEQLDYEDIDNTEEIKINKQNTLFVGDSVYIKDDIISKNTNNNSMISYHNVNDDNIVNYKKISSDKIINKTTITPTKDITIDEYLDDTIFNNITPWHLFFILFIFYLLSRIIHVGVNINA